MAGLESTSGNGGAGMPGHPTPHRMSLAPDDAVGLAVALHREGDVAKAEEIYRQVLEARPGHPGANQFLGILLHARGEREEGVRRIRKAAKAMPGDAGVWINLGNVLVESGDIEGAEDAYRRSLKIAPDNAMAHGNLGYLLRHLRRNRQAEAAFRKAIDLDPDRFNAWHGLGELLRVRGRPEEAVSCLERALKLAPERLDTRAALGSAYARNGELEKAANVFREFLKKHPDHPTALHHLAACEGRNVPDRASDRYIVRTLDKAATSFDSLLAKLDYRGPELVVEALAEACEDRRGLRICDAGCGTGLCGPGLSPLAAHLVGVDLAPGMLAQAEARAAYDELVEAELTAFLREREGAFDAIAAADTLCYFGRLDGVAQAAFAALSPGGTFVFTTEAMPEEEEDGEHRLQVSGRYIHGGGYVDRTFAAAGFQVLRRDRAEIRSEAGAPVEGFVVTVRRPAAA